VPLHREKHKAVIAEINQFFKELFPNEELCKYMWQHLASCLVGTNDNQAFNIYTGSGANGKSKLVELMSKCMGDYKATVPITLITGKRNSIGSTSSEIVQLKGIRYAVMQEPTKGDQINEGIMKELTGGDPLLGRALFCDSEIFIPQFSLAVCTNALFEIRSNDDGTLRRMKLFDFLAKFISEG
jgi:P4 family phage/plasmid primase-like protien